MLNIRTGGKMHRLLGAIAERPRTFGSLVHVLHPGEVLTETKRRKLWRRIDALTGDNLISKDTQNLYHLTPWGEDEMARLGEVPDHLVGQPNARIFVGRAA